MSSPIDQITDIITHFIGELRLPLEDLRARNTPDDGPGTPAKIGALALKGGERPSSETEDIPVGGIVRKDYLLVDADAAEAPLNDADLHVPQLHFSLPPLSEDLDTPEFAPLRMSGAAAYIIPAPQSLVAVIQQHNFLFDEDVVVVGEPDFPIPAPLQPRLELDALRAEGRDAAGAAGALEAVKSEADVAAVAGSAHGLVTGEASTISQEPQWGSWVNGGRSAEDAPELADHLPPPISLKQSQNLHEEDEETPAEQTVASIVIDASQTDTTMDVASGYNLAVNEASLVSAGLTATTIAVAGNHYSIDAIVQVNVLSSCVTMDDALPTLFSIESAEDILMNIAEFRQITHDTAGQMAEDHPGRMPESWAVTVVESDLIFLNWLCQYNFTADGDTLVLTATGTTTSIATGGNMTMNATGILYAGMSYDLLLVGGSLYDVNFITQLNVLYDHDTLSAFGAMPGNTGTIETGGNVLWNQAQIARIGASEWSREMPDHYLETMKSLDEGNKTMPLALKQDANFEGYGNLKVLYVKGDIYDINYVEQVNVAGDPDQVVLYAEETFGKAVEWSVQTGGNVLVNAAAITDYESMGNKAYVQGSLYSEALLIQSEIIHTGNEAPASIVTEAIAFIAEDMEGDMQAPTDALHLAALAAQGPDGLDSLLS